MAPSRRYNQTTFSKDTGGIVLRMGPDEPAIDLGSINDRPAINPDLVRVRRLLPPGLSLLGEEGFRALEAVAKQIGIKVERDSG